MLRILYHRLNCQLPAMAINISTLVPRHASIASTSCTGQAFLLHQTGTHISLSQQHISCPLVSRSLSILPLACRSTPLSCYRRLPDRCQPRTALLCPRRSHKRLLIPPPCLAHYGGDLQHHIKEFQYLWQRFLPASPQWSASAQQQAPVLKVFLQCRLMQSTNACLICNLTDILLYDCRSLGGDVCWLLLDRQQSRHQYPPYALLHPQTAPSSCQSREPLLCSALTREAMSCWQ